MLVYLSILLVGVGLCQIQLVNGQCSRISGGGYLVESVTLDKFDSPCEIEKDLIIGAKTTLTLNEGTELRFAPGVMLAVNGTLLARGSPNDRIVLTKKPSPLQEDGIPSWPDNIRLVDDFSVSIGRLQIQYKDRWRGICANFENWTATDVDVACQQLGFRTGNFSFISWTRNDSSYLLYHRPSCIGNETNILNCPGSRNIQIGSRICQFQQTIHLNCSGMSNNSYASDYWWGLEFYNTTITPSTNGIQLINESSSILQNVDIRYAGVTKDRLLVPALRASPSVPSLINVTIRHSALDATNFTEVKSSTIVYNSLFENNRGHGLVVESTLGHVQVQRSTMRGNYGNGIKTKFLDMRFVVINQMMTFCNIPNLQRQTFPQIITGIPSLSNSCGRKFESQYGQRLTLNVLEMDIEPDAVGTLEVFDGRDEQGPRLATYTIINGTLPMGVVSTFYFMYVKFSWVKPRVCPTLFDCVKFSILVDSAVDSTPEFFMHNTTVTNNLQHGVFLENGRNYLMINSSIVTFNGYGAGIRVYGGAADVLINASQVEYNQDNGVNITHDGGWRIFNRSSFSHNAGHGINITLNETSIDNRTRYSRHQITEVSRSFFVLNDGNGVRVGNYCRVGRAVVNDSVFISNQLAAIEYFSCFKIIPDQNVTNFTVGYNRFENNTEHAIKVTPLINTVGVIANNTFAKHRKYVLLLDNTNDFLKNQFFLNMLVNYEVTGNVFTDNRGYYVANLRLTQWSQRQTMLFRYNVFTGNAIQGNDLTLNERTRAYAVVVLSSSNIVFNRNRLENPDSKFELATFLVDLSVDLNATMQWWGTTDYQLVIGKIFDQYSRYNLARIIYHPALAQEWLWTPVLTDRNIALEVPFLRGDRVGGRLAERLDLPSGRTYYVDRDMSIIGLGQLFVTGDTRFEFANALGMLVSGYVSFVGTDASPITMKLYNESTWINSTTVRLVDGPSILEGRLEVRPTENDEWGTICMDGWTMIDASVACQQMGLVVHPSTWQVSENIPGTENQPIWRSDVQCTSLDLEVLACTADDQFEHSCNHSKDVYLRCVEPTWAGIRFLGSAVPSKLSYVSITEVGLMDPATVAYTAALKIDFNVHTLNNLLITNNLADGVQIMHNDVFANARLESSIVQDNKGNGVSVRTSFFELYNCTITGNEQAGFEYDPSYTTQEALQIRAGVRTFVLFDGNQSVQLGKEDFRWVMTPQKFEAEANTYELEVQVSSLYKVVVDIVDYNPMTSVERVTVFDSRRADIRSSTVQWTIEDDLPDFPVVSQLQTMTIRWTVNGVSSGRLAFVIRSKAWDWRWPFAMLSLKNSTISGNRRGVVTRHYNQPSNEFLDLFFRYRWGTVRYYGVSLVDNRFEAIYAVSLTRYNIMYIPTYQVLQQTLKVTEIAYEIDSCYIARNGLGVVSEQLTVEYSNNVWIWRLTNDLFEANKGGGFNIELPRVNLLNTDLYNHSFDMNNTVFYNNQNFEFLIDGFYCNSSIAGNRFQGNQCNTGCITISGTEKDLDIHDNEFVENTGRFIIEFNMNSHTPFTNWVDARVSYNIIKRNKKPPDSPPSTPSKPTSYALGVRGLQNITINRNLFANSDMDFELLGGHTSSFLENYLDATQNWWGTIDQVVIRKRIFDFDDWNSFAIAEYFPFLSIDSFSARIFAGTKYRPILDLSQPLGGRITEDLTLLKRSEPYVVISDLTIMSDVSLIIYAGVEIQFHPNVGILVLGSLVAVGSEFERIKFNPVLKPPAPTRLPNSVNAPMINHPDLDPAVGYQVRFRGTSSPDEGFIEIYNRTEKRWTIVCDDAFNDRTAEVACRTMNKESSNVAVRRNRYYDIFVLGYPKMHDQVIEWFWRETLICDGSESDLSKCHYKINYKLSQCLESRDYVFVRCGPRNLPPEYDYWGNIRFSTPTYEYGQIIPGYSSLNYVDIYGAGILHEDKVAAVQSMYRVPESNKVRIHHCSSNGYDYIAPMDQFFITNNVIQNNYGYAMGTLVLNGQSTESPDSQFIPLKENGIPYNMYGTIRMCTTEKLVYLVDRALIYHKYDFETVDCVKVVRSRTQRKQIGIRFLQVNLYNDTLFENTIELYNSEFVDPLLQIGKLTPNSSLADRRRMYTTSVYYDTMAIRISASPAFWDFGFIAEVVTLPLSPIYRPDFGLSSVQRITNNSMTNNEGGGWRFQNVGDNNIRVRFSSNFIEYCGLKVLNNTSPGVIDIYIQNTRLLTISNNFITNNAGGININTTTKDNEVSLYANITNNIIMYNTHCEPMRLEGHQFQGFDVRYNYIAYNDVDYRNIFGAFGVQLNFTRNIVYNNTGQCILNASVLELISINQQYTYNAIYNNWASSYNRSTFFLKSAKYIISYNYLLNQYNVYEISMYNRTKYPDGMYPSVQAQNNWWGRNSLSYVAGRVWDRLDDDNLIKVQYEPFLTDNSSILEGKCYPGWRQFDGKCYWYFGGVVPYDRAESICRTNRGRLGWARDPHGREANLGELVTQFQFNYDINWGTWVYNDWQLDQRCTMLRNYRVEHAPCDTLLPFICERDPYIKPVINLVPIVLAAVITGGVLLLVVCPLAIFAMIKSYHRKEEKIERRETLRQSIRSASTRPVVSMISKPPSELSDIKKQRPPLHSLQSKFLDVSGVTMDDSSTDSVFKAKYDFHRPSTPASSLEQSKHDVSSYYDSDLGPIRRSDGARPPRVENEIPCTSTRVLSYGGARNRGFAEDDSFDASIVSLSPMRRSELNASRQLSPHYSADPASIRGYGLTLGSESHPSHSKDSSGHKTSGDTAAFTSPSGSSGYKGPKNKPPRPKPNETAI